MKTAKEKRRPRIHIEAPAGTRLFKKYPNRRLYDTHNCCYVVHDDLIRAVNSGQKVHVAEMATGKDITRDTLLVALRELEASRPRPKLTVEVLTQLLAE